MRIAIFFDGKNFYRSLTRYDSTLRVDYDKLAEWITARASYGSGSFAGAHYYVGVSRQLPEGVGKFLNGLETRPGYFVHRTDRVMRSIQCRKCNDVVEYPVEKQVDTQLTADIIRLAAADGYDKAVLVSGDADFIPALDAVASLGKQAWLATWSSDELSRELRKHCFGHILIKDGIDMFRAKEENERHV